MKVFIGLSGGVDSAVAAYLLKEQGYDVTCGFMRNWDSLANNDYLGNPTLDLEACSQELDYNDAVDVAAKLGLPLVRIDFVEEYWDNVFSVFLDETKKGNTPNPDILCNRYIKFDAFLNHAKSLGFDVLATGHYAKLVEVDGVKRLAKANDLKKDQSYFLAQVSLESLQQTIFPLQDISKIEVRAIADKLGLSIAKKKDSTGICFIGERQYREFLSNYLAKTEGNIIDIETQTIVGKHQGVMYYTIGQRHGLNISAFKGPYFVCGKNKDTNTLYVCVGQDNPWLFSDACLVNRINWYSDKKDIRCKAKFRYRQKDNPVSIHFNEDNTIMVTIDPEVSGVTPGQEVVFYDGDIVLGAGRIDLVYKNGKSLQQRIMEQIYE